MTGWEQYAACKLETWDFLGPQAQKRVCASCPVFDACRAYADRIEKGKPATYIADIYAGETPNERLRRRHQGGLTPHVVCDVHGYTTDVDLQRGRYLICSHCRREQQARYRAKKRARLQAKTEAVS